MPNGREERSFAGRFLFLADAEQKVQENAEDCRAGNAGNLKAEERDVAAERVVAADADDHD